VSFEITMTTSVTRPYFTAQQQTCNTKTDFFWSQAGLVLRLTVSDHVTGSTHRLTPARHYRLWTDSFRNYWTRWIYVHVLRRRVNVIKDLTTLYAVACCNIWHCHSKHLLLQTCSTHISRITFDRKINSRPVCPNGRWCITGV